MHVDSSQKAFQSRIMNNKALSARFCKPNIPAEQSTDNWDHEKNLCSLCQSVESWTSYYIGGYRRLGLLSHVFECSHCTICEKIRGLLEADKKWKSVVAMGGAPRNGKGLQWGIHSTSQRAETEDERPNSRIEIGPGYLGNGMAPIYTVDVRPGLWESISKEDKLKRVRRLVGGYFDVGLLRQWLDASRNIEQKPMEEDLEGRDPDALRSLIAERRFRVVDVKSGEVVELTHVVPYVALSYVWGTTNTLRSCFIQFQAEGKKHVDLQSAPATIHDAAELVSQLGIQYLWVDQICIDQDVHGDKASIVNRMGTIYAMATLTIIAATGSDVHAGLTGLPSRPRSPETPFTFRHRGNIVSMLPPRLSVEEAMESAIWTGRGWTYQEMLLSPCCVIFTDEEVFFQAGSLNMREAYGVMHATLLNISDTPSISTSTTLSMIAHLKTGKTQRLSDRRDQFCEIIEHYSSRRLAYPEDRLAASLGILMCFKPRDTLPQTMQLLSGLDPLDPLVCLGFGTGNEASRRIEGYGAGMRLLPSWSWAGWTGAVTLDRSATAATATVIGGNNVRVDKINESDAKWPYLPEPIGRGSWQSVVLHLYMKCIQSCLQAEEAPCRHSNCDKDSLNEHFDVEALRQYVAVHDEPYVYVALRWRREYGGEYRILVCKEVPATPGLFERVTLLEFDNYACRPKGRVVKYMDNLEYRHICLV